MEKQDKFKGCLLGGAIGDALGYAIEFESWSNIKTKYGDHGITRYELNTQGKAEVSDDTQMTLFTANGLLFGETRNAVHGITKPIEEYVETAYLEWLQTQTAKSDKYENWHCCWLRDIPEMNHRRAPGSTCLGALMKLQDQDKVVNNSKGCGGVMRAAPIGLYYANATKVYENERDVIGPLLETGAKVAQCTHKHPLGYLPAAVLAYIVYHLVVQPDSKKAIDRLDYIISDALYELQNKFPKEKTYIDELCNIVNLAIKLSRADRSDLECISQIGEGWVGEEALAIAVYCCCKYRNNFEQAICAAVNHSGDSDSTGAIAGNIMGAMLGVAAIPDHYLEKLELKDVIIEMASDLYTGCITGEHDTGDTMEQQKWIDKYIYAKH